MVEVLKEMNRTARLAGLLYLITVTTGILAPIHHR